MSDQRKTQILVSLADAMSTVCMFYIVASVLLVSGGKWGLHLGWLLFFTAVSSFVFGKLLCKPREGSLLTVLTAAFIGATTVISCLVSSTDLYLGYIFVILVGCSICIGMPLYFEFHRPPIMRHLTCLDLMIAGVLVLLLMKEAQDISNASIGLMVLVLLLDVATAVGLRISEDGDVDSKSTAGAMLVTLGGSLILAALIALLISLLSKSRELTGNILKTIGAFFTWIDGLLEKFLIWLTSLMPEHEIDESLLIDTTVGSVADAELEASENVFALSHTLVGIIAVAVLIAVTVVIALLLRKKKLSRMEELGIAMENSSSVRRNTLKARELWQKFLSYIRFRRTAHKKRNTAAGIFVWLERKFRKLKIKRMSGESMREFLLRIEMGPESESLANALDYQYYGDGSILLSAGECKEIRKHYEELFKKMRSEKKAEKE